MTQSQNIQAPASMKLVPIEPTESMIVQGFESWPHQGFSQPEVWEAYCAMSGCQQAAHRAKLCWAAMLAAAPPVSKTEITTSCQIWRKGLPLGPMPILYTDTINGDTVLRDDVWLATTEQLASSAPSAPLVAVSSQYSDEFKSFHRMLCKRFGYTHDEAFWWRDQVSLMEFIAGQVAPQATAEPLTDTQIIEIASSHLTYGNSGMVVFDFENTDNDVIKFARALLAATPPTSKAIEQPPTAQSLLVGELESFLIDYCGDMSDNAMAKGVRGIMYRYNQTFDVATSKADTGELVPKAVLDALVEGCAEAFARPDSAGSEDAEACSHALGLYRGWKSAIPSTIKAEPTGQGFDACGWIADAEGED